MANPNEKDSCQDLAWHKEEGNPPVVVTLLGVTLSLPDPNDNPPFPIGRDDPRVRMEHNIVAAHNGTE